MKTWIIILTVTWVVFRLVAKGMENYIRNDHTERIRYYFMDGASNLGLWHGLVYGLYKLTLWADVILFIIYIINKL